MTRSSDIPENDNDLRLARAIGKALSEGRTPESAGEVNKDELGKILSQYKSDVYSRQPVPDSGKTWQNVDKSLPDHSSGMVLLFKRHKKRNLAAAAVLLIAVCISLFSQYTAGPELIASSQGEMSQITLLDQSVVTLRPYSELFHYEGRNYKLKGEAYFDVQSDPSDPFTVELSKSVITVLGTRFTAGTWGDENSVWLEEGRIALELQQSNESLILNPGEAATAGRTLTRLPEADGRVYTDWMNNELTLSSTPLTQVITEIEQHFNIRIQYNRKEIAGIRLDGTILLDEAAQVLEDVAMVSGGSFEPTGDAAWRFRTGD